MQSMTAARRDRNARCIEIAAIVSLGLGTLFGGADAYGQNVPTSETYDSSTQVPDMVARYLEPRVAPGGEGKI